MFTIFLSATRRANTNFTRRFFATNVAEKTSFEFQCERLQGDDDGIVVFRMNRPQTKNAINKNLQNLFYDAMESVKFDKNVRAIILKSDVTGAFCSGADLKERAVMPPDQVPRFVTRSRRLMRELELLPMPVIAAIDGVALGGGLELALACDLRVASDTATMGLVETRLGIIPGAGGTQRLPRTIGVAAAKELIFTAQTVDGVEAYRMGLVNHVVPQTPDGDGAFRRAIEVARRIIPRGPVAVRLAKAAINQGMEMDLDTALTFEEHCYAQIVPTKDRMEGLMAFKEKRAPRFTGE